MNVLDFQSDQYFVVVNDLFVRKDVAARLSEDRKEVVVPMTKDPGDEKREV